MHKGDQIENVICVVSIFRERKHSPHSVQWDFNYIYTSERCRTDMEDISALSQFLSAALKHPPIALCHREYSSERALTHRPFRCEKCWRTPPREKSHPVLPLLFTPLFSSLILNWKCVLHYHF